MTGRMRVDIEALLRREIEKLREAEQVKVAPSVAEEFLPRWFPRLRGRLIDRAIRRGRYIGRHRRFPRAVLVRASSIGPESLLWVRIRPRITDDQLALVKRAVKASRP